VLIAEDGSGVDATVRGWLFDGFDLTEAESRRGDLHEIRCSPVRRYPAQRVDAYMRGQVAGRGGPD
jgi:hypothetical protein